MGVEIAFIGERGMLSRCQRLLKEYCSHFFRTHLGYEWCGAPMAHRRRRFIRRIQQYVNYPHPFLRNTVIGHDVSGLPDKLAGS